MHEIEQINRPVDRRLFLRLVGLTGAGALGLSLAACAPQPSPTPAAPVTSPTSGAQVAPAAKPSGQPRRGGTLRYAIGNDPASLDPILSFGTAEFYPLVYNTLVQFDEQLNVRPELAESWDVRNNTEYVFKLHKGVKFHNGKEMTADDVKFSLDRFKKEAIHRTLLVNMEAAEVVDPSTVRVLLSKPDAGFLSSLALFNSSIFPKGDTDFKKEMLGTGPFKFVSYSPKQSMKLERNPAYWEQDRPYLDGWEFLITNDRPAIASAITSGTADIAASLAPNQFEQVARTPGVVGEAIDSKSWWAFTPNLAHKPWDDVRVRKAFALGIDRTAILQAVNFSLGKVSTGFVMPHWHWAYADFKAFGERPDVDQAKKLLAEAGFPNGGVKGTLITTQAIPHLLQMSLLVQEQLRPIGFQLEVNQMEFAAFLKAATQDRDFDLLPYNSTSAGIDPDHLLGPAFQSNASFNFGSYSNPKVDELLGQGRSSLDQARRKATYAEAQKLLAEDVANVPVLIQKDLYAHRDHVKNATFLPGFVLHLLRYVWLDK